MLLEFNPAVYVNVEAEKRMLWEVVKRMEEIDSRAGKTLREAEPAEGITWPIRPKGGIT